MGIPNPHIPGFEAQAIIGVSVELGLVGRVAKMMVAKGYKPGHSRSPARQMPVGVTAI